MPHVADRHTVWGHLHELCMRWADGNHPLVLPQLLPVGFRPGSHVVYSLPAQGGDDAHAKL